MTTYYCCDLDMNHSNMTEEEKAKFRATHIKEHKRAWREFKKIMGLDVSESEDEEGIIDDVRELIARPPDIQEQEHTDLSQEIIDLDGTASQTQSEVKLF
jgi:hypothetical protein